MYSKWFQIHAKVIQNDAEDAQSHPKMTPKVTQSDPNVEPKWSMLDHRIVKIRRLNEYNLFMDRFGSELGAQLGQLMPNLAPTSANLDQSRLKVKPKYPKMTPKCCKVTPKWFQVDTGGL